jgi:glycosyltransferase involved in cell wall biosynthesis
VFGRKGCSIHVQEVLRALVKRGAAIDLYAARVDGRPPDGLSSARVHELPTVGGGAPADRERLALAANAELRKVLATQPPYDLVYERYSVWSHAAMDFANAVGVPGLLEVNAPLIEEQDQHRGLIDRATATQVAERAFNSAAAVLAVSEEVASYVCRFVRDPLRVHVVPNGVDPSRFGPDVRASKPARAGAFTVGFVGNMRPWHGLPLLVEAFEMLHRRTRDVRLLLIGGGPERETVLTDVSRRGLFDATVFSGAVDRDDIPGLLESMDVAVAPYPQRADFYFSPLKVYEYMAAGLPTVASAIGQLNQIIRHEQTGLLVPPGDAGALADAIDRLRLDPTSRRRLGRAARQYVTRHHTCDSVVDRILQLALANRGANSGANRQRPERVGAAKVGA